MIGLEYCRRSLFKVLTVRAIIWCAGFGCAKRSSKLKEELKSGENNANPLTKWSVVAPIVSRLLVVHQRLLADILEGFFFNSIIFST